MRHLKYLCVIPVLAGCAGSERSGTTTVSDSAGIAIVTSTASAWGDNPEWIDTVPLVRIGDDQPGPYQFSMVWHGVLLDGGVFAVSELATREVRVFTAEGRHERSLGRQGRGPGEFAFVTGLYRYRGDSLVAYDQGERRATVLPLSGGEPRVVRNLEAGNLDAFGASGWRLVLYNPGSRPRGLGPGLQWDTTDVVSLDLVDGTTRTIGRLPSRQRYIVEGNDTRLHAPEHRAIHAASDSGFYWGVSDRYEIRFHDGDGRLLRIMRRSVEPLSVTPDMIDAWVEANLEEVRRTEGAAAVDRYRQRFSEMPTAKHVPLFDHAFVDGGERLWVGEGTWPALNGWPHRWSVFRSDGAWLGDVEAPEDLRILDIRDGLVLGVHQEDGEAPYVQVHRLRRP